MKRQRIYIHRYDWSVIVYYNADRYDVTPIMQELVDAKVDGRSYNRALRNLAGGLPDTGLTYSNTDERISVIVLSHASSKAEFSNTWFHEVFHCAVHIAEANGIPCDGEAIAYIGGELARDMQPVAARLMCPDCK